MKNVKHLLFYAFILILILSCQKDADIIELSQISASKELSVQNAKIWFNKTYNLNNGRLKGKGDKFPLWEGAYSYQFPFGEGIVVPLIYHENLWVSYSKEKKDNKKPKATAQINSLNYLLIYKDKENKYVEEVVNLIPEEGYLLKSKFRNEKSPFEGYALIKGWDDRFKKGFYYEAGLVKGTIINTKNAKILLTNCQEIFYYDCPSSGVSSTGQITNFEGCVYLYSETLCTDINGPAGGGGSGGGYGDPGNADGLDGQTRGLDCASFDFKKTASNWQEAGVKDLRVKVKVIDPPYYGFTRTVTIPGQIVIGLPINRANGSYYSPEEAADIATSIIDGAAFQAHLEMLHWAEFPTDAQVEAKFRAWAGALAATYGGTASVNGSGNGNIRVNNAIYRTFGLSCN